MKPSLLLLGLALFAAACGSSVDEAKSSSGVTTGGGGSGATGTVSSSATGMGGTSTGSSSVTTASSSAGGGACAGFADQASPGMTTIHIVNEGGVPLYLSETCGLLDLKLAPIGTPSDVSYPAQAICLQTCQALQTEGPIACGDCAVTSRLLPPGGSFDYVWDDTGLTNASMPASCYAFPPASTTCSERVQAAAGTYWVDVSGYASCSGSCNCTPDGECYGSASGTQALANPATLSYPSQNQVTVTFPPCALPCP